MLTASNEYAYIRSMYGVDPKVGQRVSVDGALGTLVVPHGQQHYLHVRLDSTDTVMVAHPTWRVDYEPQEDNRDA